MRRKTLAGATPRLDGIGLHTGAPGWVRLLPSESPGRGIVFRSENGTEAGALAGAVMDTRRCTTLALAGSKLRTVEHLLSAVAGCGITDALIEYGGPEVPILDGSAKPFTDAIRHAGASEPGATVESMALDEPLTVRGEHGELLIAIPADRASFTVVIDYPDRPALGVQAARFDDGVDYAAQVAPARTYGFLSEFEHVRALGLAGGASVENCVALRDDGSPDPATPLRFSNEPARHKLLDLIGDLSLIGRPLQAEIVAIRPSHAVNCVLARQMAARALREIQG